MTRIDREPRQQGHGVLAREFAEAQRIFAALHAAVVVQVEAGRLPGVRFGEKGMRELDGRGTVLWPAQVVSLEIAQRRAGGVVVELLQQQDVRPHALDDLRHRACLDVVGGREVAAQRTLARAIETAIEGGDADEAGGPFRRGGGH